MIFDCIKTIKITIKNCNLEKIIIKKSIIINIIRKIKSL